MTVAVVGALSLDRVDGGPPRIGGCPFYAGRAFRALGTQAVLVTKCAAPDRSLLEPPLAELGLPVIWHDSSATTGFSIDYSGEDRRMLVHAIADPWTPDELKRVPADWVHVAPLTRGDLPPDAIATLARGRRVSLDGQGLVRPARAGLLELDADYDPELLSSVSILKLSEREAGLLVDGFDERSLRRLGVPEIVVTLGSRGCIVFSDGLTELVRSRRVKSADPTGAGDAFAATYLAARSSGVAPAAAARQAGALVADLLAGGVA